MILDAQNLFSDAQAVTAAAASTNIIDLGAVRREVGTGQDVYVVVSCDVAMTDASSDSTLAVTVQSDDAAAFGSATDRQTIGTFPAVSAIGTRLIAKLQPEALVERYIRLYYTPANGNLSTGSFTAFLTTDADSFRAYADGITIS